MAPRAGRKYLHRAAKASRGSRQPTGGDAEADFIGDEHENALLDNHPGPSDGSTTLRFTHNPINSIESSSGTTPAGSFADADDTNPLVQEASQMRRELVKRKRRGADDADGIQDDTAAQNARKRRAPRSHTRLGSTPQDPVVVEDSDGAGTGTPRAYPINSVTGTPIQHFQSAATAVGAQEDSVCQVCFDTFLNAGGALRRTPHFNDECQGVACVPCWDSYVSRVDMKDCNPMKCMFPNCLQTLDSDEIKTLVSGGAFDDWCDKAAKKCITDQGQMRECPRDSCKWYGSFEPSAMGNIFACQGCGYRYCLSCEVPMHGDETCEAYQKRIRKQIAAEKKSVRKVQKTTKDCPNCAAPIEKNEGCNHMTCAICKHEFCWLCFAPYEGRTGIFGAGNSVHDISCPYNPRNSE